VVGSDAIRFGPQSVRTWLTFYRVDGGSSSRLNGLDINEGTSGLEVSHQMNDEGALYERAREVIRARTLPNRRPDRMWGGPGAGANCLICNSPVERHQLEYELEFAGNGDGVGVNKYQVHIRCFAAWEQTLAASSGRDQRDAAASGTGSNRETPRPLTRTSADGMLPGGGLGATAEPGPA
jgi:hypothetical protein